MEYLTDFPAGPLDRYRKQATFDWKKLKLFIEDEKLVAFKVSVPFIYFVTIKILPMPICSGLTYLCFFFQYKVWKAIEDDPLFQHSAHTLSLDEQRHLATKRMYKLKGMQLVAFDDIMEEPRLVSS